MPPGADAAACVEKFTPHPGPQEDFVACDAFEALFGGAAGPGKTTGLLLAASRHVEEPSYKGLLMRRTNPELEGAGGLIEQSFKFFAPLGGSYLWSKKRWKFPSGAFVDFRACEYEHEVRAFGGWEVQLLGVDELTTFPEGIYIFLLSRLRSTRGLPCFARSTSNPGGRGAEWVTKRWRWWLYRPGVRTDEFAGPYARPGQVAWVRRPPDYEQDELCKRTDPGANSRTFYPGKLADNPALAASGYGERLDLLDPLTRRQLKDGDWMARSDAGTYFKREWFALAARPKVAVARVRAWDRAATEAKRGTDPDWTAGVLMSLAADGTHCVEDVVRARLDPSGVYDLVARTAEADADLDKGTVQLISQDPGQAGVADAQALARRLSGFDVRVARETGSKEARARPLSGQCAPPASAVRLVPGTWNDAFLGELQQFPRGAHDDQVDAASMAHAWLAQHAGADLSWYADRPRAPGFRF